MVLTNGFYKDMGGQAMAVGVGLASLPKYTLPIPAYQTTKRQCWSESFAIEIQ